MSLLTDRNCEACRKGAPLASREEIAAYMEQLPDWKICVENGIERLTRTYTLKNFDHALRLTNRVGTLAEEQGHHPAIVTEWGRVTVSWWTHKIGGLHANDFIMAAKTDELFRQSEGA